MPLHYVLIDPDKQVVVPREAPQAFLDTFFKTMILRRPLSECYATMVSIAPAVEPAMSAEAMVMVRAEIDAIDQLLQKAFDKGVAVPFGLLFKHLDNALRVLPPPVSKDESK